MKFAHLVKHNGIYYPAGTEVPIETSGGGVDAPAVEVSGKVEEPKVDIPVEKPRKYSEEDLNMPYMKLKSLATKEGFKVEKSAKADDIKEMLRSL